MKKSYTINGCENTNIMIFMIIKKQQKMVLYGGGVEDVIKC
jgi:hypothetical protein